MPDNQVLPRSYTHAKAIWEGMEETLWNLYERWQDESEYEDFSEYSVAAAKKFNELGGAEFISLTSRPFKMTFSVMGDRYEIGLNSSGRYTMKPA